MPSITLAVTPPVLQQVQAGALYQRQLAIQGSVGLSSQLSGATSNHVVTISLGGCIPLAVGDTGAIWAAHQAPGLQSADFDDLYNLLSRRAGATLTLTWWVSVGSDSPPGAGR